MSLSGHRIFRLLSHRWRSIFKSQNHPGRWLEVLGCGMVHPNVLTEVGVSPDDYQGYAFGLGLDRIAMLYFDIPDLRLLFEGDWRLLRQFNLTGVREC